MATRNVRIVLYLFTWALNLGIPDRDSMWPFRLQAWQGPEIQLGVCSDHGGRYEDDAAAFVEHQVQYLNCGFRARWNEAQGQWPLGWRIAGQRRTLCQVRADLQLLDTSTPS